MTKEARSRCETGLDLTIVFSQKLSTENYNTAFCFQGRTVFLKGNSRGRKGRRFEAGRPEGAAHSGSGKPLFAAFLLGRFGGLFRCGFFRFRLCGPCLHRGGICRRFCGCLGILRRLLRLCRLGRGRCGRFGRLRRGFGLFRFCLHGRFGCRGRLAASLGRNCFFPGDGLCCLVWGGFLRIGCRLRGLAVLSRRFGVGRGLCRLALLPRLGGCGFGLGRFRNRGVFCGYGTLFGIWGLGCLFPGCFLFRGDGFRCGFGCRLCRLFPGGNGWPAVFFVLRGFLFCGRG